MNTKIHIIHGYAASPQSHWFPWLAEQLKRKQLDFAIYQLPDAHKPTKKAWLEYLQANASDLNEDSIIVAHSLGCICALRYLEEMKQKVRGIILVAGFIDRSPMRMFNDFMDKPLDCDLIKSLVSTRLAITASDDYLVPQRYNRIIVEKLDTKLVTLHTGKHFLDIDGCYELPSVVEEMETMISV